MRAFPHRYRVEATATEAGKVIVESHDLPSLRTTMPPEFGGPAGSWSPETLLVAAIADCYALTFRGLAKAAGLAWTALSVEAVGTLERPERVTRFTRVDLLARLTAAPQTDAAHARRLLARAEETCLITRSLIADVHLEVEVEREEPAEMFLPAGVC
jgi:organic hydroperoxide reductase OsmC/OhrA